MGTKRIASLLWDDDAYILTLGGALSAFISRDDAGFNTRQYTGPSQSMSEVVAVQYWLRLVAAYGAAESGNARYELCRDDETIIACLCSFAPFPLSSQNSWLGFCKISCFKSINHSMECLSDVQNAHSASSILYDLYRPD